MNKAKQFAILFAAALCLAAPTYASGTMKTEHIEVAGGIGKPMPIIVQGAHQQWLDVAYANQSEAQKMDIYVPEGQGPFPVILAVHGGAFKGGDKRTGEVNAELKGLLRGYAVVCANYRLSGEAPFPAAIHDLKAAVRFIKAHAQKYNLDPKHIAAWGDSAGGNLVSMLGTTAGHPELEDLSMGNACEDSGVTCVVDWFGPTDFCQMDPLFKASGKPSFQKHDAADSAESLYMGIQITKIPNLVKFADPQSYISKKTVPFFIENCSEDPIVPTQQSVIFADKLASVLGKEKVTYIQLQGAGHGGPQFETQENLDKVFTFLDNYMK